MALGTGWVCDICLRGQMDKMTVADTVTVTSGRGQLWRGDMWPGIVMANSYLACQVGYPYWWRGSLLACGTKGREFESRLGLHLHRMLSLKWIWLAVSETLAHRSQIKICEKRQTRNVQFRFMPNAFRILKPESSKRVWVLRNTGANAVAKNQTRLAYEDKRDLYWPSLTRLFGVKVRGMTGATDQDLTPHPNGNQFKLLKIPGYNTNISIFMFVLVTDRSDDMANIYFIQYQWRPFDVFWSIEQSQMVYVNLD